MQYVSVNFKRDLFSPNTLPPEDHPEYEMNIIDYVSVNFTR